MRRFLVFLPLLGLAGTAHAQYDTELLVNGGAEDGPGGSGELVSIPGWTRYTPPYSALDGYATAATYGASPDFPTLASPGAPDRGNHFFMGGSVLGRSAQAQTLDLTPMASDIDKRLVDCTFGAYLGGSGTINDSTEIDLEFLSATSDPIETWGSFTVRPNDRNNVTGMLLRSGTVRVPVGARSAIVSLRFYGGLEGGYSHAYADNASVKMHLLPSPEPSSMIALTAGAVALLRRKRRS